MEFRKKPLSCVDLESSGLYFDDIDEFFIRNINYFIENSIALHFTSAIIPIGESVNVIGRPAADSTRGRRVRLATDGPQGFTFRKQIEDLGRERFVVTAISGAMAVELHDFRIDRDNFLPATLLRRRFCPERLALSGLLHKLCAFGYAEKRRAAAAARFSVDRAAAFEPAFGIEGRAGARTSATAFFFFGRSWRVVSNAMSPMERAFVCNVVEYAGGR